jgi:hypothetical protein
MAANQLGPITNLTMGSASITIPMAVGKFIMIIELRAIKKEFASHSP